ncbi:hypothetical protein OEZ86_009005 [Tetradesmus obliquus]|nr:hypothetical protein OEZ86_009005 [Tetradesmus obliquus]
MGDIILNPGFKPASAMLAAQGTGRVLARGLDTQSLEVQSSGSADVFAKGAIGTANVTMSGTGRVTLAGVTKAVTAHVEGISSLFVDAASDDVSISAKPSGISKVYYTRGKCDAGQQLSVDVPFFSMDLGLSACVRVQGSAFPRYKAAWSCGMKATGTSMCTPGATQQAATAAQGADISVQSVTPDNSEAAAATVAVTASSPSPSPSSPSASASASAASSASSPAAASSGNARAQAATVSLLQGPATPEEEAADISVGQAGHRRLLKTLLLPPLLPLPSLHHHGMFHQPLTTTAVASSSSSDDGNGNTVSVTVGGNGGVSMTVGSVTCSAKQQDLYIAGK